MERQALKSVWKIDQLDGLRGWLSFAVVLSHVAAFNWVTGDLEKNHQVAKFFFGLGAPAVDCFFVMSGMVIALSLDNQPRSYFNYLASRALRLLPIGAVGLLLSPIIRSCAIHLDPSHTSPVFLELLQKSLTSKDYLGIATLGLLPFNANAINPPLWTLIIEQHVSIVLPAFNYLANKKSFIDLFIICFASTVVGILSLHSLFFAPAFVVGILAKNTVLDKNHQRFAWLLLILGILVLNHRLLTGDSYLWRLTAPLGAAMILVALRSIPTNSFLNRFLASRPSLELAKISFSLYATHFAVLMLGTRLTPHNPVLGSALSIPVCIVLGYIVWILAERPCSMISKKITRMGLKERDFIYGNRKSEA